MTISPNQAPEQPVIDLAPHEKISDAADISLTAQADAEHRRWKDKIFFLFSLSGVALLFLLCLGMVAFGDPSSDEQDIWIGVLIILIAGVIGFVIGKKS